MITIIIHQSTLIVVNNIKENMNKWLSKPRKNGGNRKTLKNYINCENDPLLGGDPDDLVLERIPQGT